MSGQKTGRFYGRTEENDSVGQKTRRFYGRTEENDSVGQKARRFYGRTEENDSVGQKTRRFYGRTEENESVGQKTRRFYGQTEENESVGQKTRRFKPKWAMVASHTARRSCITNMYLAEKPDGTPKYTLAQRMSVSGHKTENQYINYIKCSLDEVAEMVAAANDKDGDNLF